MKDFKPCAGGCGRLGIYKNGYCQECNYRRLLAIAEAKAAKRKKVV